MIVLDAAALVDVVIDQPSKAAVLDRLEGEVVHAPAHQPVEVLSAIARLYRAGVLDEDAARAALREAAGLPQQLHLPDGPLLQQAFALRPRVRVVDATYVALAVHLGAELVTTDHRLEGAELPCAIWTPTG